MFSRFPEVPQRVTVTLSVAAAMTAGEPTSVVAVTLIEEVPNGVVDPPSPQPDRLIPTIQVEN